MGVVLIASVESIEGDVDGVAENMSPSGLSVAVVSSPVGSTAELSEDCDRR